MYACVLLEILQNLDLLKKEYKISCKIRIREYCFRIKLSNGDTMTYISLNLVDINEKIKKYLIKKYNLTIEEQKNNKRKENDLVKQKFNFYYDNSQNEDYCEFKIYDNDEKIVFSISEKNIIINNNQIKKILKIFKEKC